MSDKIAKDTVVQIHYTLTGEDKQILDSSVGEEPLLYLHGYGQIISGLESALVGKNAGEKLQVAIEPQDGYGEYDPQLTSEVKKKQFPPNAPLEVGALFEFTNSNGDPVVVRITELLEDAVKVDANHPLAGMKLFFDVEVVSIRPATKEELEHGHAHGAGGHHHG